MRCPCGIADAADRENAPLTYIAVAPPAISGASFASMYVNLTRLERNPANVTGLVGSGSSLPLEKPRPAAKDLPRRRLKGA